MSTYRATATREGNWWVIDVEGVGITQSRTLAESHAWAVGLIEAVTGEADADVTVTPQAGNELKTALQAKALIALAEADLKAAADQIRSSTLDLLAAGYTQQDVALMLGVSRQRVQQLASKR